VGIEEGFDGLVHCKTRPLDTASVSGILHLGGTILGTTSAANPFNYPIAESGKTVERDISDTVVANFHQLGLDALIVIGGDGSLRIAQRFFEKGIPLVGIPKTIDNDISGTVVSFGFDTAVNTALLIPEIPYDISKISETILERERHGKRFSIVVVAEGAFPKGGEVTYRSAKEAGREQRLGGVGERVADAVTQATGKESRVVVLGHLQRGGPPTTFDRVLGTRFGAAAVRLIRRGQFGRMVALRPPDVESVPIKEAISSMKKIPLDSDILDAARGIGISLGD
jgi:6-phosphofructokinase 1